MIEIKDIFGRVLHTVEGGADLRNEVVTLVYEKETGTEADNKNTAGKVVL